MQGVKASNPSFYMERHLPGATYLHDFTTQLAPTKLYKWSTRGLENAFLKAPIFSSEPATFSLVKRLISDFTVLG